ncbi:MAG TPA: FMN-binding protein [Gammaproteobacteria bacterium]|nr:FMN-binding protein [Gammaproteobacteria bacterium]
MLKTIKKWPFTSTAIMIFILSALAFPAWASGTKAIVYLSNKDFLKQSFNGDVPEVKTVWLKGTLKTDISKTLGHNYPALRVRYWLKDHRSAWILEEIGREKPITVGFVVQDQKLVSVKVLVFRENRGGEIRFPSFTEQFDGSELDNNRRLNRRIDGISGATLSVNAVRKLAAVALQLSDHVMKQQTNK